MSVVVGSYNPSLRDMQSLATSARAVPVSLELLADLDTPVSAYLKVCDRAPSFLLESVEGGERLGRYSFIGSAPRRVLTVSGGRQKFDIGAESNCADPLATVQSAVESYGPPPRTRGRFEGGMLGYLSYEAATYFEQLPRPAHDSLRLPDAAFMDVDTLLVFDHVAHTIRIVSHAWLDRSIEAGYSEAVDRIDAIANRLTASIEARAPAPIVPAHWSSNMSQSQYEHMVQSTKCHIRAGDIIQAVVSQRLSMPLTTDPFSFYRRLRVVNPSPFMYFLDFGDHQLVGASPELLLQVEGDAASTRPIAGTRPRGADTDEDEALAEELLADEKERAEHLMLVDLARNDLGRVSAPGTVQLKQFMGVERFSHVMHLVSDVIGRLDRGQDAYSALRSTFPAGTVSGAPKIRAMQIIADQERDCRGPYAGAVGFAGTGGNLEMAITIRTAVVVDGTLHVQAGAGIVADSVPEREYHETLNKAQALLRAAGATE